jgi:hypothetical protein
MPYRDIWQKTKRLKRIHEVCLKCRNAYQESQKRLNNKNQIRLIRAPGKPGRIYEIVSRKRTFRKKHDEVFSNE